MAETTTPEPTTIPAVSMYIYVSDALSPLLGYLVSTADGLDVAPVIESILRRWPNAFLITLSFPTAYLVPGEAVSIMGIVVVQGSYGTQLFVKKGSDNAEVIGKLQTAVEVEPSLT